jgi:hypothetical protein
MAANEVETATSPLTYFWLVPEDAKAQRMIRAADASCPRDAVPASSTRWNASLTRCAQDADLIECFHVGFESHPDWGTDLFRIDLFFDECEVDVFRLFDDKPPEGHPYNSPCAASFHIDPNSLDLVLVTGSAADATLLYDEAQSVSVGRWVSSGDEVIGQTILPSNNPILSIDGALFSFRWYPHCQSAEIYAAKKEFTLKSAPERGSTLFLPEKEIVAQCFDSEYPMSVSPNHRLEPAELLKLHFDIRYCIFQYLFLSRPDDPWCGVWKEAVEQLRPYVSVRECTLMLNRSYQLLNPAHAPLSIAREAAEVFYGQTKFSLNLFDIRKFIWVLSQMNGPLDPRSMIKHVSLCVVGDNTHACVHSDAATRCCYEWESKEINEIRDVCAVVTANLPALRDVLFRIRLGGLCVGSRSGVEKIIEAIKPSVACLASERSVTVRVEVSGGPCAESPLMVSGAMITSGTWRNFV